jgi:DNA-binding NarL/FixJ family response regulator
VFADPRKWSNATISVLVCDDGAIGRRQLTVALESSEHIEVVAEADGGETALAEAIESTPDVVWMGLGLPGLAGVRLIASIGELVPGARFVVMCGPDDAEARGRALRVGAMAVVRREEAPALAVTITEQVAWGHPWLEARDLAVLRDAHAGLARQAVSVQQQSVPPRLGAEDLAVLDELAQGRSVPEVAQAHGVASAQVQGTVADALALLHRHARAEAMAYSVANPLSGGSGEAVEHPLDGPVATGG